MNNPRGPVITFLLLLVIEAFLFLYFPPAFLMEPSLTAGGDTPSHFMSAVAMHHPASIFSPVTWVFGNFAGFPLFLQYFPFPFALMGLISWLVSLQESFKLVTLLAILPLPPAVFYCLRRLGFREPSPILGAVLSLPFLFMTENHMWGGNIASTLAGEFAFGISFVLAIMLTGRVYADAPRGRSLASNSFIEALVAFSSGYPILHFGMGTGFLLLRGGCSRYILSMHALAFGLIAFWILPLVYFSRWNAPFAHWWSFQTPLEVVPPLLWPSLAGILINTVFYTRSLYYRFARKDLSFDFKPTDPELYLWWQVGTALLGFCLAPFFGLVDVRFLPFAQISIVMLGAVGWSRLLRRIPYPAVCLALFTCGIVLLTFTRSATVDSWIRWNYSGLEYKPLWESFSETNRFLEGSENSPRVFYEHSEISNGAGSARVFEMLPFFSGRSTMEGLYMQSSINAPFIYYVESEISQAPTMPFANRYYSGFNPARAAEHFRLFNVSQMIAITDNTSCALDYSADFEPQITFPPFRVYRLKDAPASYVTPLQYQPLRIPELHWRDVQYEWFRKSSLRTPLVVAGNDNPGGYWKKLPALEGSPGNMREVPLPYPGPDGIRADTLFSDNRIQINTSVPGHPLWLKVSYHPSWRVSRGKAELYLASPAFMLVVPETPEVVLEFDTSGGIYYAGRIWSAVASGLCILIIAAGYARKARIKPCSSQEKPESSAGSTEEIATPPARGRLFSSSLRLGAAFTLLTILIICGILLRPRGSPQLLYDKIGEKYEKAEQIRARVSAGDAGPEQQSERDGLIRDILELLDRSIVHFPDSATFDYCIYYKAQILLDQGSPEVRKLLLDHLREHPDTRIYSESHLLIGETYSKEGNKEEAAKHFRQAAFHWPDSTASRQAGVRLAEITGWDAAFREAAAFFDSGRYLEAYLLWKGLITVSEREAGDESTLYLAYCCFFMNRWEEAANLFTQWLSTNYESPGSHQAQLALRQCNVMSNNIRSWQGPGMEQIPPTLMQTLLNYFKLDL